MKLTQPFQRLVLAGLLIWLPIVTTFLVVRFLIDLLDKSLAFLPGAYQPESLMGLHIPGSGIFLSLIIVLLTGLIATNILGHRFIALGEAILAKIPLVRTIYKIVQQLLETVFSANNEALQVVLIEYPRKGLWSIAFQTGDANEEINSKTGEELVSVFLPPTPNPTSGFLLMVPKKEVIELDIPIDVVLKMIISLGIVQPKEIRAPVTTKEVEPI